MKDPSWVAGLRTKPNADFEVGASYSRGPWMEDLFAGTINPVYKFDHGVLGDADVVVASDRITVGGNAVELGLVSPYTDMLPGAD